MCVILQHKIVDPGLVYQMMLCVKSKNSFFIELLCEGNITQDARRDIMKFPEAISKDNREFTEASGINLKSTGATFWQLARNEPNVPKLYLLLKYDKNINM